MSPAIYNTALVTHIVGITIMAGTTFIDFVTFRAFSNAFKTDRTKGLVLGDYLHRLQRFLGIGMLIILLSGVAMMIKLHEVWGAQLWFRIKMGVLLIIIINGLAFRRVVGAKLKTFLAEDVPGNSAMGALNKIEGRFTAVQIIQLLLFALIYVLSIFKFN